MKSCWIKKENITPNKKLWNLYEIWCYLKIHSIIKELGYIQFQKYFSCDDWDILFTTVIGNEKKYTLAKYEYACGIDEHTSWLNYNVREYVETSDKFIEKLI